MFQALQRYELCKFCSQRQGFKETRATNPRRCFICGGLTTRLNEIGSDVLRKLEGYEFRTFSVGLSLPEGMQEREDQLRAEYKLKGGETVKAWLSRGLSDKIARSLRKVVDKLHPDLLVLVDLDVSGIKLHARPLFIYGRYTKPSGVAQRKTFCTSCGGDGCGVCDYSGYETKATIESIVQKRLGGLLSSDNMRFTWIGTEDAESTVYKPGRPFLVEVKNPKKRGVPRGFVSRTGMGQVRLNSLKSLPSRPLKLPNFRFRTRVAIESSERISVEDLVKLSKQMRNVVVEFLRPGEKPVYKKVYRVKAKVAGSGILAEIDLDGGLPVKRLVNGDLVSPSISEVLKADLKCRKFDILKVQVGKFQFG